MRKRGAATFSIMLAASVGFLAGALVTGILLSRPSTRNALAAGPRDDCGEATLAKSPDPEKPGEPVGVSRPPPKSPAMPPTLAVDPIADLRSRGLQLPVQGLDPGTLRGSFHEKRGAGRLHEAIDILAPRHTPVVAVEGGTVARLFTSQAGGTTLYQFDPTKTYIYYYAHLQRYAAGIKEGDHVKRGQVLAYVGTSGNAPENVPHLHFAIFKAADQKRWWSGTPIDPYLILKP